MKRQEDPTRDPASEARDDHASNPAPVSPERGTPRMTEAWKAPQREGDGFSTVPAIHIAYSVMEEGRKLENELAEMTRQRDEFREELRSIDASLGYDDAWADGKILPEAVAILRSQRDTLFAAVEWCHDNAKPSLLIRDEVTGPALAAVKGEQP